MLILTIETNKVICTYQQFKIQTQFYHDGKYERCTTSENFLLIFKALYMAIDVISLKKKILHFTFFFHTFMSFIKLLSFIKSCRFKICFDVV